MAEMADAERPNWWCYQLQCRNGHDWRPGTITVSWLPCLCAGNGSTGHLRVSCRTDGCTSPAWVPPASPRRRRANRPPRRRGNAVTAGVPPNVPYAPEANRILDHAVQESARLRWNYVGTEHLLLGVLADEGNEGPPGSQFGQPLAVAVLGRPATEVGSHGLVRVRGRRRQHLLAVFDLDHRVEGRNLQCQPHALLGQR